MMTANGLAKLAEELGELQQIVGKMLAYGIGDHPDGGAPLIERFNSEAGDVMAAIELVAELNGGSYVEMIIRSKFKLSDFELECTGMFHELKLSRFDATTFHLTYRYHDGNEYAQRTLPLTMRDSVSVRARHDKIIEHFNKV